MKRTIGQRRALYEEALRAIIAYIEEHNKRYGRPSRNKEINVHMIASDVRAIYEIAKDAFK